jgi:hypothetical protein
MESTREAAGGGVWGRPMGEATTATSVPWSASSSLRFFLEARENVRVHAESTTLADITARLQGPCFVLKMCGYAKVLDESLVRNLSKRHIRTCKLRNRASTQASQC